MSKHTAATLAPALVPYVSLEELKEEHSNLLRRRRCDFEDNPSIFLDDVETFLRRGFSSGSVLGDDAERYSAQSLLTYWSNVLYREGREPGEDTLAEFNPEQAPELSDEKCPYFRLNQPGTGEKLRTPGWHRLIDECLRVLERDRFLSVVGASGSGRSAADLHGESCPPCGRGRCPGVRPGAIPLR